jgi:hypothetical protein
MSPKGRQVHRTAPPMSATSTSVTGDQDEFTSIAAVCAAVLAVTLVLSGASTMMQWPDHPTALQLSEPPPSHGGA